MVRRSTGDYLAVSTEGEAFKAFVPRPLPPDPPVVLDGTLERLHGGGTAGAGSFGRDRKSAAGSKAVEGFPISLRLSDHFAMITVSDRYPESSIISS